MTQDVDDVPPPRLATFKLTASGQPTLRSENQFDGRTGDFAAFPSRYVVRASGVDHHGRWWAKDAARRFAASLSESVIIEVPVYFYCPAWGRVFDTTREQASL